MEEYILLIFFMAYLLISGIIGTRLIIIYSHKEENNRLVYIIIKCFIIIGYILSWTIILLVPIDVYYNTYKDIEKYIDIFKLFRICYWLSILYIFMLTPIMFIIYSESDKKIYTFNKHHIKIKNQNKGKNNNNKNNGYIINDGKFINDDNIINDNNYYNKMTYKTIYKKIIPVTLFFFLSFISFLYLTFLYLKKLSLSLNAQECELWYNYIKEIYKTNFVIYNIRKIEHCENIKNTNIKIIINLKFNDYIIIIISFIGFLFFIFYGGIGLISLPLNLINSYIYRKKKIKKDDLKKQLDIINRKSKMLLNITETLQKEKNQLLKMNYFRSFFKYIKYNREKNFLNYTVHNLEKEYDILLDNYTNNNNILFPYLSLFLGIIFLIISTIIIMHLLVYIIIDVLKYNDDIINSLTFLDSLLVYLVQIRLSVLSTIIYTFIMSYLLVCSLSGFIQFCSKLSLGFIFVLEKRGTYLNSLLLNICLFFFISLGISLFSTKIFYTYSSFTYATFLFDLTLKNIRFIGPLYSNNTFLYILLLINFITLVLFLLHKKCDISFLSVPEKFSKITEQEIIEDNIKSNDVCINFDRKSIRDMKLFK
ncbi:putative membrane protein [Plasmodium gaboni]|uniref:Putative membrane protein n=1 Tax=Plasmodium gaboni TaxID=647221 RepID=A0A151LRQ5_9APIC|nr:putative membrane protein [Plasmodium gaboni]KYO01876.1 putative membrane protein [Plasmodium gaboni]